MTLILEPNPFRILLQESSVFGDVNLSLKVYDSLLLNDTEQSFLESIKNNWVNDEIFRDVKKRSTILANAFLMTGNQKFIQDIECIYSSIFFHRNIENLVFHSSVANQVSKKISKNFQLIWKSDCLKYQDVLRNLQGSELNPFLLKVGVDKNDALATLSSSRLSTVFTKYKLVEKIRNYFENVKFITKIPFISISHDDTKRLGREGVELCQYNFLLLTEAELAIIEGNKIIYEEQIISITMRLAFLVNAYLITMDSNILKDIIILKPFVKGVIEQHQTTVVDEIFKDLSPVFTNISMISKKWYQEYQEYLELCSSSKEFLEFAISRGLNFEDVKKTFKYETLISCMDKYCDFQYLNKLVDRWNAGENKTTVEPVFTVFIPEQRNTQSRLSILSARRGVPSPVPGYSSSRRASLRKPRLRPQQSDTALLTKDPVIDDKREYYIKLLTYKGDEIFNDINTINAWKTALKIKLKELIQEKIMIFEHLISFDLTYDNRKQIYYIDVLQNPSFELKGRVKKYVLETLCGTNFDEIIFTIGTLDLHLQESKRFDNAYKEKDFWKRLRPMKFSNPLPPIVI